MFRRHALLIVTAWNKTQRLDGEGTNMRGAKEKIVKIILHEKVTVH